MGDGDGIADAFPARDVIVRPCPKLFPSFTVTWPELDAFCRIYAKAKKDTYLPDAYRKPGKAEPQGVDFMDYLDRQARFKGSIGKVRASEIYDTLWMKMNRWLNGRKLYFDDINGDNMQAFEAWMKSQGNCLNTISHYFRAIRSWSGCTPEDILWLNKVFDIHRDEKAIEWVRKQAEGYESKLKAISDSLMQEKLKLQVESESD